MNLNNQYTFCIQYKNNNYRVTVESDKMHLEYNGHLSEQDYNELKRYLKVEGFLDQNTKYTII
jgi:hypothetical protein